MAKIRGLSWLKAKPRAGALRRKAGALFGVFAVLMAAVLSFPVQAQAAWDANGIRFYYDENLFVNPISTSNGTYVYCASAPLLGPGGLYYHDCKLLSDMYLYCIVC